MTRLRFDCVDKVEATSSSPSNGRDWRLPTPGTPLGTQSRAVVSAAATRSLTAGGWFWDGIAPAAATRSLAAGGWIWDVEAPSPAPRSLTAGGWIG